MRTINFNSLQPSKHYIMPTTSPNLNQYDVENTNPCDCETWLTSKGKLFPKCAVIELSTKAVKLLVNKNPDNTCHNIFSFYDFYRETTKTETGMLLDFRNTMDESGFVERVLPTICQYAHTAQRQFQVDMIYTIATAAYRTASNQKRILRLIKAEAGLNVRILSKNEEANASLHAYIFSCSQREKLLASHHHILIDQGGGSTEISLFNNKELVNSCSLETGTTLLKTLLFRKLSYTRKALFEQQFFDFKFKLEIYKFSLEVESTSNEIIIILSK